MRLLTILAVMVVAQLAGGVPLAAQQAAVEMALVGSVDRVAVEKGERRLLLMRGERNFRSYRVALGRNPAGAKSRQGDGRTPEGAYVLDWRKPESKF